MLANASLWFVSISLAVVVHALGLMLFDPEESPQPSPSSFSEEIVVMLGEGPGGALDIPRQVRQPESAQSLDTPQDAADEPLPGEITETRNDTAPLESLVSAPAGRGAPEPEPESARQAGVRDVGMLVEESTAPRVPVPAEEGDPLPSLSAADSAVADTIAAAPVAAEAVAESRPVSVAAASQHSEIVASAPETAPHAGVTSVTVPDTLPEQAGDAAVPEATAAPAEQALERSADDTVEQVVGSPVDATAAAEKALSAVVLEFETVKATTASQPQAPDPQAAGPVSIEEQIARALTPDESQRSGLGMGIVARYAGLLKGRLEKSMHYPRAARLAGQQGSVIVRFVIDRNGTVLSIVLEKPSGYAILDREAVEMIERAEPFPTMPGEMAGEVLELRVPIAYRIEDASATRDIPPIFLD